jgi:hypothetical protein
VFAEPGRTASKKSQGDVDASAGFDEGENDGYFGSGLLAADVDPVFTTEPHGDALEFSSRLLLSSSSGYSKTRVSFRQSASV